MLKSTLINSKLAGAIGAASLTLTLTIAGAQTVARTEKVNGSGLYELAVSETTGKVYVAAAGSRNAPNGKILVLHPATLAVTDSIILKENPPYGVGINDKTQTLYTSNTRSNSVSAIDLKTGRLIATIGNGKEKSHTREIVVDEKKNLVYVSDVGQPSSIWVIDGKTNQFRYSIENTGKTTTGLALDPGGKILYVTNMGDSAVGVIDLEKKALVRSFPSGGSSPVNLALDAKNGHLFVANQGSHQVTVLHAATGKLVKTLPAGKGTLGITFDPVKRRVYTADRQEGTVTVIHADNLEIITTLKAGSMPNTVAVNKKSGEAYVTNKARSGPRPGAGETAPAAPPADPLGDTVSYIRP